MKLCSFALFFFGASVSIDGCTPGSCDSAASAATARGSRARISSRRMICNCVSRERKSVRYDLTCDSGILGSPSLSSGLFAAHQARSSSSS